MRSATSIKTDESAEELLALFLAAKDDRQAGQFLERLVHQHADPVIHAVVRRKMEVHASYWCAEDEEKLKRSVGGLPRRTVKLLDAQDVHASGRLLLIEHLSTLKASPDRAPMQDFRAYVGRIALNAFGMHMRRRFPERHRLRRKLWYLAQGHTSASGFAVWPGGSHGEQLCGFRAWEGERLHVTRNYGRWQDDPHECQPEILSGHDHNSLPFPELVAQVLNWAGGPMEVDVLVNGLTALLGMKEKEASDG